MSADSSRQESYLDRARASLKQSLAQYGRYGRSPARSTPDADLRATLRDELEVLSQTLSKLEQRVVRIATFGLVSRGKSAVLNALVGQKVLPTGPLNGVTLYPRSVRWAPGAGLVTHYGIPPAAGELQVELIDTPGLDEIDGEVRAQMAREVTQQADLILFIVSGDITRTEYRALCELRRAEKPLILVFNKIDLYPEHNRQAIYQNLQSLAAQNPGGDRLRQLLSPNEIVMVAAEPTPFQVRVEWADGRVTHEWETPPPQVEELKQKIISILNQEGRSLLALNALTQASQAEAAIARKTLEFRQTEAEALIWKFVKYKALIVAFNPIALLDWCGGTFADLALIRNLADLYGLPMTRYEASQLLKTILISSGSLLLTEWGSGLLLGMGKSAAAVSGVDHATGFSGFIGAAIAQAGIAGYGSYSVGRAAQIYLEQGCSWGPQGAKTIVQEILSQVDRTTILYRLRQELQEHLQ
ncbi:MAG: GTP-binding protein [Scytolyngbya sp. HA4215-MV1]|jgi:hypothetical protein|nr:GTP-binding protein [Scytolyngbya sp. HA4215-MV1]